MTSTSPFLGRGVASADGVPVHCLYGLVQTAPYTVGHLIKWIKSGVNSGVNSGIKSGLNT